MVRFGLELSNLWGFKSRAHIGGFRDYEKSARLCSAQIVMILIIYVQESKLQSVSNVNIMIDTEAIVVRH